MMSEEDYILTEECEEGIIKRCLNEEGDFDTDEYERILFNIIRRNKIVSTN